MSTNENYYDEDEDNYDELEEEIGLKGGLQDVEGEYGK